MKTMMRGTYLFIALAMLLGAMLVFTRTADVRGVDDTDLPTTIHALLVIMDADPQAPNRYEADHNRMNGLLNDIDTKTSCMLNSRVLRTSSPDRSDYPTRDRILAWIEDVNPEPNDVVLVYFAGHGSKRDASELEDDGTYVQVRGGILHRRELVEALEESDARNCRLRVLITDSCSGNGTGESVTTMSTVEDEYGKGRALSDLFVRHEGLLHLASASPGEVAFGDDVNGGWFTSELTVAIYKDRPADTQFVRWDQIFSETHDEVKDRIQEMPAAHRSMTLRKGIKIDQTPKAYSLPEKVKDPERWVTGRGKTDNMAYIPAGKFRMGQKLVYTEDGIIDESSLPIHSVYLDAFYIDTHEVTLGEYKEFLVETGHKELPVDVDKFSRTDQHPVVGVTWHDAMAYARWKGKRLPTEAEWEKAARGGLIDKRYPWGNDEPDSSLTNLGRHIVAVGSYAPNPYGLYDMSGNVEEWCMVPWDEDFYANSPTENPFAGPMSLRETIVNYKNVRGKRVVRGSGNFVGDRRKQDSIQPFKSIGFRCAMDAD